MNLPRSQTFILLLVCLSLGFNLIIPFFDRKATAEAITWYNTSWLYSKKITIDHMKVEVTLDYFPVLFDNTSSDFSHAQSDGDDFVFVSSDNVTKYNHEIDSYNSTIHRLIAWVNITSLSHSADTIVWLYYGNAGCSSQQNVAGTWNAHYKMVQHMNGAAYTNIDDSTSNDNDVTGQDNSPSLAFNQLGKIGNSVRFTASNALIFSSAVLTAYPITVEVWAYPTTFNSGNYLISNTDTTARAGWMLDYDGTTGNPYASLSDDPTDNTRGGSNAVNKAKKNAWNYIATSWDGSVSRAKLYANKTAILIGFDNKSVGANTAYLNIGSTTTHSYGFTGSIDEVRVSNVIRSSSWINASYDTVNSPSTFLTTGSEQSPHVQVWTTKMSGYDSFRNQASWVMKINGYNTFSNSSSWESIPPGWDSFGNTSSWGIETYGWNSFSNYSLYDSIDRGWNSFGTAPVSWNAQKDGWNTFGNHPSWISPMQGWVSFSNKTSYTIINSGWNFFRNITVFQLIGQGWNSFTNTPSFISTDSGWISFSNHSSFILLGNGWNVFYGMEGQWNLKEQGWDSFGNNASFSSINDGWSFFNNYAVFPIIAQGWNSFEKFTVAYTVSQGWNSFRDISLWKSIYQGWSLFSFTGWYPVGNGWNSFGNSSSLGMLDQGWNTFSNSSITIIADVYPDNGDIVTLHEFTFGIEVNDALGDVMNITWYKDVNGSWIPQGDSFIGVGNGTYYKDPSSWNFDLYGYNYTYRVAVISSGGFTVIKDIIFMTAPLGTGMLSLPMIVLVILILLWVFMLILAEWKNDPFYGIVCGVIGFVIIPAFWYSVSILEANIAFTAVWGFLQGYILIMNLAQAVNVAAGRDRNKKT